MKDEQFAKLFAITSAYCGLALAVVLMVGTVTMTGTQFISFFEQGGGSQAATVATAINGGNTGSALTPAQVQAVVGLLQSFGADSSIVSSVQAALMGQPPAVTQPSTQPYCNGDTIACTSDNSPGSGISGGGSQPSEPECPNISHTLSQGDSGSDVKDLQEYLGVEQTGYFGSMTANAVAVFQANEGLAQVGVVGPLTLAAIAENCGFGGGGAGGSVPPSTNSLSVSPTSGQAPLTVFFKSNIVNDLDAYSINFGDGTSGDLQNNCSLGYGACGLPTASHVYTAAGTYIAKLMYQPSFSCPPGAMCPAMMPAPQVVGTVTITVSGATSSGPVCPVYQTTACQAGTHRVDGATTYDANKCPVPNWSCVPNTDTSGSCPPPQPTTACSGSWQQVQLGMYSTDSNACTISWTCVPTNTGGIASSTGSGSSGDGFSAPGVRVYQSFDAAGMMAAVAMMPFNLMVDSLTDIFVMLGVGQ